MLYSNIPAKIAVPFGNSAAGAYIRTVPVSSQIGIQDGAASYTDGFVPLNFTPLTAGGVPPFGQDFNGLLNAVTKWQKWQGAGGTVKYDSAFSTTVGGYPAGAVLLSSADGTTLWLNTADNNSTDPDGGSPANWVRISGGIVRALDGTVGAPGFAFSSELGLGIRRASSGTMAFTSGGSDRVTISNTGTIIATGGGTFTGSLSSTTNLFTSGSTVVNTQGSYIGWNRSAATGEMNLVCHRGGNAGAFFFDLTPDGSTFTRVAAIDSTGISELGTALSAKYALQSRFLSNPKVFKSSQFTVAVGTLYTFAHGLGAVPDTVDAYQVCTTNDQGYTVGQVVRAQPQVAVTQVWSDATNVYLFFNTTNMTAATGISVAFTLANWKFYLVARLGC